MATIVSTRILRLQGIVPRLQAVAPMDVAAVTPYESLFRYDPINHIPQFWNGTTWVNFKAEGGIYTIAPPTLVLDSGIPGESVGTALGDVNIYTAVPPDLVLDSAIPGMSVLATSP